MRPSPSQHRAGLLCAIAAHTLWGLFPLYWGLLHPIGAAELVAHRILWSFVLLALLVPILIGTGWQGDRGQMLTHLRRPRVWGAYALSATMVSINWLAFVYAVTNNRILDASLGYYINPLLNVLLGVLVLGERLSRPQWIAISLAAVGVSVMTIAGGGLPWPAILMATSFAFYALIKKRTPLPALIGLWMEMTVLLVPTLLFLGWLESQGTAESTGVSLGLKALLLTGGIVTILPLALFSFATQRVALSTIGVLQYIGPTLQLICGAVIAGEPFGTSRAIGFLFVWSGIAIFLMKLHADSRTPATKEIARPSTPSS